MCGELGDIVHLAALFYEYKMDIIPNPILCNRAAWFCLVLYIERHLDTN